MKSVRLSGILSGSGKTDTQPEMAKSVRFAVRFLSGSGSKGLSGYVSGSRTGRTLPPLEGVSVRLGVPLKADSPLERSC
jgi:hypothetical protein